MTKSNPRNEMNDTHEEVGHNKYNYGSMLLYIVDFVEIVYTMHRPDSVIVSKQSKAYLFHNRSHGSMHNRNHKQCQTGKCSENIMARTWNIYSIFLLMP